MIQQYPPNKSSKYLWWITLGLMFLCCKCAIKVGNPHSNTDSEKKKVVGSDGDTLASSYLTCCVLPVTSTDGTTVQVGCSVYNADGSPATSSLMKGLDWNMKPKNSDSTLNTQKSIDPSGKYNIIFTVTGKDSDTILKAIDAAQITANATSANNGNPVVLNGTLKSSAMVGTKLMNQNSGFRYYRFVVDQYDNGTTSGAVSQLSLQYDNVWHQSTSLLSASRKAGGIPANQNGILHSSGASTNTNSPNGNQNGTQDSTASSQTGSPTTNVIAVSGSDPTSIIGDFIFPQKIVITGYIIEGGEKQLGCPLAYHLEASENGKTYSTVAGSSSNKLSCHGDPQTITFAP